MAGAERELVAREARAALMFDFGGAARAEIARREREDLARALLLGNGEVGALFFEDAIDAIAGQEAGEEADEEAGEEAGEEADEEAGELPTCAVCLAQLPRGDARAVAAALCGHAFHARCLARWAATRPDGGCPVCRAPLQ